MAEKNENGQQGFNAYTTKVYYSSDYKGGIFESNEASAEVEGELQFPNSPDMGKRTIREILPIESCLANEQLKCILISPRCK